ncbi:MAG: peptidylprolyl isomerase [Elusimicrobiales bacterium]
MKNKLILITCGVILFAFSCQRKEKEQEKIIAKVGNTYITESYLNEKIVESGEFDYLKTKIGKKQFLDVLINERLLKLAAQNSEVASSKEYRDEIERLKDEFKKRLEDYKDIILTRMWLDKIRKERINISDSDIKEYIKKYPYTVSFNQVISSDYEKAQAIFKSLKDGASFDRLAADYSKSNDVVFNKIPSVLYGELMDELNDMVFKMKVGDIGGIVKSKLGYHIVKKTAESKIENENPRIKERVRRVLEKKRFDEYLSELEKKYSVEVLNEEYK